MPDLSPADAAGQTRMPSGVQSIERTFELLEAMADAGGRIGLSELADRVGFPKPTVHRLMRTLVALGYARQEPTRDYSLGPRLVRLVDASSRLLGLRAAPYLQDLVNELARELAREQVRAIVQRTGMPRFTPSTITDLEQLSGELKRIHISRADACGATRVLCHSITLGKACLG